MFFKKIVYFSSLFETVFGADPIPKRYHIEFDGHLVEYT